MIEKKVVTLSIIALMVGIATIVPLAFLMTATAQPSLEEQPQFNVEIPYAYVKNVWENPQTIPQQSDQVYVDFNEMSYALSFNATPRINLEAIDADGIFEYYMVEVSSDKGYIGNFTHYSFNLAAGANSTGTFHFYRDNWFDSNSTDTALSVFWGSNSTVSFKNGAGKDWNLNIGVPETLTFTVYRQGWVVLKDYSTIAHLGDSEPFLQIQLQKYGDGYLYNTIIPESQLPTTDLLSPYLAIKL